MKNIEIYIKNTFNRSAVGTVISKEAKAVGDSLIKGVSSIDEIDLLTLQGSGMVGVKGISSRLFGALASAGVSAILITQASSEYSITFAIVPSDTERALQSLNDEFETEIKFRNELNVQVEHDLSIVAIVGERMKNTPGISATLFAALGRNGIGAIATAQGSSELNISVVIKRDILKKALNVIHEAFFLSFYKELHLFIVGTGTVGGSLLQQIRQQQVKLKESHRLSVNVVGIARSKRMLLNPDGIDLTDFKGQLEKYGEPSDLRQLVERIKEYNLRNSVFVDCTADENVSELYKDVLSAYVSVVTANKIACSSAYSVYKDLKATAQSHSVKFIFETNVGAGLPIINTVNDLIKSGDKIIRMEAVLSGTLNFIFNVLSESVTLSEAIQQAKEKGFSEPDPRIDLSGVDVVRKLLILARETGVPLEKEDVKVEPFLPDDCFSGSLEDFWQRVKQEDAVFEDRRKKLTQENKKLRFVAELDKGNAQVALKEVDANHPAYQLEGSNNIILLTTERYHEEPMIIKGYGAGAEVTAAGVFADIIRVVNV
jgi:aspartokinase/homoserine dehydrogenase 1